MTGSLICEFCGARFVVPSLARDCEMLHCEEADDDQPEA